MRTHYAVISLLSVNALMYAWVALLFFIDPWHWFAVIGVEQATAAGYTELRTVYAGLMGALAVFLALCAWQAVLRRAGVLFLVISYAGLLLARSWGILIDGGVNAMVIQLYIVEWLALLLAVFVLWLMSRTDVGGH